MKKVLKILKWTAGILVLLLIVTVIALKLFFPREKVRQMAVEQATESLGRKVTVQGLDVSIWGGLGVELQGVTIANPPGFPSENFLQAENVDVKLRLLPLLSGEYRVKRFILDNPTVRLLKKQDGSTNYHFAAVDSAMGPQAAEKVPAEARPAAAAVSFDELQINDGNIYYRDDSAGVTAALAHLDISTELSNPSEGHYTTNGKLKVDSLALTLEESYPVIRLGLAYQAELDLTRNRLDIEKADLELNGLRFTMNASVENLTDAPLARASIGSDEISVADLFQLLPEDRRGELSDFSIAGNVSVNADITYDASKAAEPLIYTGTAVISDMAMSKAGLEGELTFRRALLDFKTDNVRMNIEDGKFDGQPFKGHLIVQNFDDPAINGELAGSVNLAFAEPFLPAEDNHHLNGRALFDLKASGRIADVSSLAFSGTLKVDNGSYSSNLLPEPIDAFTLDAYFDNDLVNIRQLNTQFASGNLDFSGRINNLVPYMLADSAEATRIPLGVEGKLNGTVNLELVNPFLPEKGSPEASGKLAMDMRFAGNATTMSNFQPWGTLSITDGSYRDSLLPEPITLFTADMSVSPDTITINNMYAKFESSDAAFSGKLANPFPYLLPLDDIDRSKLKRPVFFFDLSSHHFDTDKLFPEAVPGSGQGTATTPPDSVSMVIMPDIDGTGTVHADTVIYSGVEFTNIDAKVKITGKKIQCYDATGNVYTGDVIGSTTIDLTDFEKPVYTGDFQANQVEINDFISRFTPFGDHVYGKGEIKGTYNAAGWDPDAFLNSLTLTGKGSMRDGKIITSGALYSIINSLAERTGNSFSKEQSVKNLNTDIIVRDGMVALDEFKTRVGDLGDVTIGGFYGFDGKLDYRGSLLLSQSLSKDLTSKGGLLGGLADVLSTGENERIALPLKIGGDLTNPSASIDFNALTETAKKNIGEKAGGFLKDLFKKKDDK
jgi:hypothetical protein